MRLLAVIPARHASTRLPGKPLADIGGRSMVARVVDQCRRCAALADVVVATDDARIARHVEEFGARALMTSPAHPSGTDRCHEAFMLAGGPAVFDAVVNVQGDEPFIEPAQIDELCALLRDPAVELATLAQVVTDDRDLDDPGEVKVIVDAKMDALYFSRVAIPNLHKPDGRPRHAQYRYLKHVGLYGYRAAALARIVQMPPSPLERSESLEQLRWLENCFRIRVGLTDHPSFCVDTPADLEEARRRVSRP